MKLQYLGDSKDSFKWDYHDYLINSLRFKYLDIILMLTPDDNTKQGKTEPDWFPARNEIIKFCHELKSKKDILKLKELPYKTKSNYKVIIHKPDIFISNSSREYYFKNIENHHKQIILLDPDNGFEPEKSYFKKHIRYCEIKKILEQISDKSIISVFQHFRKKI